MFIPILGEMIQFDKHMISNGLVQPPSALFGRTAAWFMLDGHQPWEWSPALDVEKEASNFAGTICFLNIKGHWITHFGGIKAMQMYGDFEGFPL